MSHYPDNSNNVICPSAAWDTYCEAEERANTPDDEEMIKEVRDSITGKYEVSVSGDSEDWRVSAGFLVYDHPDDGLIVAYHAILDSSHFTQTAEEGVVPADQAPQSLLGLLEYWLEIGLQQDCNWTKRELDDANAAVTRWREDLKAEIDKARRISEKGRDNEEAR